MDYYGIAALLLMLGGLSLLAKAEVFRGFGRVLLGCGLAAHGYCDLLEKQGLSNLTSSHGWGNILVILTALFLVISGARKLVIGYREDQKTRSQKDATISR